MLARTRITPTPSTCSDDAAPRGELTVGGFTSAPAAAVHAGDALLDALQCLGAAADDLPCRVEDADLWFAEVPAELDRAKELCVGCPVRQLCLDAALARHEPWGVWGGSIFDHGVVIARKRPRGRPRKDARDVVAA